MTINGKVFGKQVPLVFILLASKNQNLYIAAFEKYKEIFKCNFKNIIIDFEVGLKNVLEFCLVL
jgi:hypothetical protein